MQPLVVANMWKSCCLTWFAAMLLVLHIMMVGRCEGAIKLPPNVTVPAVFVFGDSIVDQGNNNALKTIIKANFPPYGKDFQGGVPTGRFSNGRTPPDFIAEELGITDIIPAYLDPSLTVKDLLTGVSFASGGCGYDPQTSQIAKALPLSGQLNQYKEYIGMLKANVGEQNASKILSNSLHLVVAGSDDIANTYYTIGFRKKEYDVDSYTDLMVSSASSFVQELYKAGARRIGVFGIPPVGCVPFQRTISGGLLRMCAEDENQAARVVNSKLSPALNSLNQSLSQSTIFYVDIYNPLLDLIQHPQNYGFEVSDKGCCGTGDIEVTVLCNKFSKLCDDDSKYVFWDSYHPTERAYKILVDQILKKYVTILTQGMSDQQL